MANKIGLAEQQLIGFKHRDSGYGLIELITAMGLTKKEWQAIKRNIPSYLKYDDIVRINEHFKP